MWRTPNPLLRAPEPPPRALRSFHPPLPHTPELCPWKSLKRDAVPNKGLLPSSCSLCCSVMRLLLTLKCLPQALDAVPTSSTRSSKGMPALAHGAGGTEPERATSPTAESLISIAKEIRETGNLPPTLELTNCPAFHPVLCIRNEGQALSFGTLSRTPALQVWG